MPKEPTNRTPKSWYSQYSRREDSKPSKSTLPTARRLGEIEIEKHMRQLAYFAEQKEARKAREAKSQESSTGKSRKKTRGTRKRSKK